MHARHGSTLQALVDLRDEMAMRLEERWKCATGLWKLW